jgi:hypothetical protein
MGLPACQQRVLDGIADALRASEPRLAAKFAIFTRLCKNEAPPWREQLPARPWWMAWMDILLPRRRRAGARHSGRSWRRVLAVSQLAIAFTLLAVLAGTASHGTACGSAGVARITAFSAERSLVCPSSSGSVAEAYGK